MLSMLAWWAALLTRMSSRPKLCHRALDESLAVRLLADVPRNKHGGSSRVLDPASSLASIVLLAQV